VIVRQELADGLPPVTGDRVQLRHVILSLLLNALDAVKGVDDRPRLLTLRTQGDEDHCARLTVRDTGVGVDPHHGDKLFEAFYTTKSAGMGMGLSISRTYRRESSSSGFHPMMVRERRFQFLFPRHPRG
jgi:C4-dicarboxylate-specific signal transduction histidine kinase